MASRTSNLLALSAATLVTLGACELVLRWALPAPPLVNLGARKGADISVTASPGSTRQVSDLYLQTDKGLRLRPDVDLTIENYPIGGRTVEISTDDLGMRRIQRVAPPAAGDQVRVLFLGDSVTFGEGVSDAETFSALLEGKPNRIGRLETFNGGVPGYGIANELELFADVEPAVNPRIAVLVFYLNDAIPSPAIRVYTPPDFLAWSYLVGRLYVVGSRVAGNLAPTSRFMPEQSLVTSWQREVLAAKDDPARVIASKNLQDWGVAWSDGMWAWMEPSIVRFVEFARQHAATPVLMIMPHRLQVEPSELDQRPQTRMREIARKLDVPVWDPIMSLRAAYQVGKTELFLDHCHLSPEGHRVVADVVATGLEDMAPAEIY